VYIKSIAYIAANKENELLKKEVELLRKEIALLKKN
jgi:cell division protein FtsB